MKEESGVYCSLFLFHHTKFCCPQNVFLEGWQYLLYENMWLKSTIVTLYSLSLWILTAIGILTAIPNRNKLLSYLLFGKFYTFPNIIKEETEAGKWGLW